MTIYRFADKYRFLSNFSGSHFYVKVDNKPVPARTVEHAFQCYKTKDTAERLKILACPTPGDAKRAGRSVTLRNDWEAVKIPIMRNLLTAKFDGSLTLAKQLMDTGNELLIEGNTWGDTFWGICRGEGENWLGFLLMGVRAELRGKL